jgi:hypothetical protein
LIQPNLRVVAFEETIMLLILCFFMYNYLLVRLDDNVLTLKNGSIKTKTQVVDHEYFFPGQLIEQ